MNNNEFTPRRIGHKNAELEQKIVRTYFEICEQANELTFILDSYLGYVDKEKLDPSMFFEFMNCADPKAFLYSKYIEKHGITFPGISISKVIELGLADVPLDTFSDLLECRIKLLKVIQSTNELKFHFPLKKLWGIDHEMFLFVDIYDDGGYTILNSDFEKKLSQHTGRFTSSESDNVVLEAIEKAVDSLNVLVKLGVIGNEKGKWISGISQLSNAIVFNKNDEDPLSVNPRLSQLHDFRRFFSKASYNPTMGNQNDMLKFKGFEFLADDLTEFDESPEDEHSFEELEAEQPEANPEEVIQTE